MTVTPQLPGRTTNTSASVYANGVVHGFTDPGLGSKLLAMGILPGSPLRVVRKGPLGSGYYVQVNRQFIALRKHELKCIILR